MQSSAAVITSVGIDWPRLKRVRDRIKADPDAFSMQDWVSEDGCADIGGLAALDAGYITLRASRHPENCRLFDLTPIGRTLERFPFDHAVFRVALNLTAEEADRLYHVDSWPLPYRADYVQAQTARERADVTVKRIDFFIRTRGKQ